MYALIQNGKVVATNNAGFGNAVLTKYDEVIENDDAVVGLLWNGKAFSVDPVDLVIKNNSEAREYLASTDWYTLRAFDSGVPVPEDVKALRAEAREKVL
jgi:hypothetical protein